MEDPILPFDAFDDDIDEKIRNDKTKNSPNATIAETKNNNQLRITQRHQNRKERKAAAIIRRNARLSKLPPPNYFIGKHKWLGGAVDSETGIIYGIPSNSIEIICVHPPPPTATPASSPPLSIDGIEKINGNKAKNIDETHKTATISTIPLPNEYKVGYFKWLRGIITNGFLYGIPAWSTHGVLKVRLQKHGKGPRVRVLPLPHTPSSASSNSVLKDPASNNRRPCNNRNEHNSDPSLVRRDVWMWHGAGLSQTSTSTAIYCIPSNAERVLKIDVQTDVLTEIGPAFAEGQNKWYGGIRGRDGCIYGIPYTASGVLRIDPSTDEVQLLGKFPVGGWKWHGGLLAPSNGVIYAFPAHSKEVLCINTNIHPPHGTKDEHLIKGQEWRISTIPIQKHPNDNDPDDLRYKWLGGAHGADGCIYGMPSDATSILRIDPHYPKNKAVATTFGDVDLTDRCKEISGSSTASLNKWQGGVLSPKDGCVYAVPANANCVLKIDTNPDTPLHVNFLDCNLDKDSWSVDTDYNNMEDKWQGGFLGRDGNIYGIPECVDRVMKLVPGNEAKVDLIQ